MDPNDKRENNPYESPITPLELTLESRFQFRCHKDIACFNACCKSIDITLTPYDVVRLKRCLGLDSRDFVVRYTVPFEMDAHGMPGLKLATKRATTECVFLGENGCRVYEDRPAACRYYALGSMGVRRKDSARVDEVFFVVKESHCLGHDESRSQTVAEYRKEQGIVEYDEMNREWRDIVLKKRSSGPTVGKPSARSLQLFDMCSYDMDSFREFIRSEGFREIFDISEEEHTELVEDEEKLLAFSMRFLRQVLFGERGIPLKANAREARIGKHREIWAERREKEIARAHKSREAWRHE